MHGRKSVLSIGMARGEFGELTRGEVTRFHCRYERYDDIGQLIVVCRRMLSTCYTVHSMEKWISMKILHILFCR